LSTLKTGKSDDAGLPVFFYPIWKKVPLSVGQRAIIPGRRRYLDKNMKMIIDREERLIESF
jgi:hypothetical protein